MTNTTDLQRMGQEFDLMPRDEVISLLRRLVSAGEDACINRTPMVPLHKHTVASILALLEDGDWQPIATAPRDGTEIQARIPGNGEDNVIAWQVDAFLDTGGVPCGGWAFTRDQEPPDCWTDGICWEVNEDECASVQPTHWKPLPENQHG